MKLKYRPFAAAGLTSASVLAACVYLSGYAAVLSVAAGAILLIITLCVKILRRETLPYFLALSLILSGTVFAIRDSEFRHLADAYDGASCEITAVIAENPQRSGSRIYCMTDVKSVDGENADFKARISFPYETEAQTGDAITLHVSFYKLGAKSDSAALRYMSRGVRLGAYPESSDDGSSFSLKIEHTDDNSTANFFENIRISAERRIYEKLPNEYGATVNGMLFGDNELMSDETRDDIYEAGIAPLFAVSGLHLSVWILGLYKVLELFGVRRRTNSAIGILFTLFFMAVTGMSVSVCRAGIMMIILLSGNLFGRRSDSLNSLGLAAFILCMHEPYIVADLGFLLSFTATAGIVILSPMFERSVLSKLGNGVIMKPVKAIIGAAAVSVFATVGTFPITVFFLKYISVWTVVTNLCVTYLAVPCMFLGGICAATYGVAFISDFAAVLSGVSAKIILYIINAIASFELTTVSTADDFWQYGTIIALCFILFAAIAFADKNFVKISCIGVAIIAIITSSFSQIYHDDRVEAEIVNCNSGYSVIIHGENFKILTGSCADYYSSELITKHLNYVDRDDADLFLLPSEQSENSETYSLLKTNRFGKIITDKASASFRSIASCDTLIECDNYTYSFTGGNVSFYDNENLSYTALEFSGRKIIFLFHALEGAVLPQEFSDADCLVCNQMVPDSIGKCGFASVIAVGLPIATNSVTADSNFVSTSVINASDLDRLTVSVKNEKMKIITRED